MKLHHLHLAQFRQFAGGLQLDDLDPGLNLFTGPNESGKSTVAEALRAAFFERHNTSSVAYLQPWGDSAAAPQVELAFTWQDQRWLLKKRFLKQARCDLTRGNEHFSGAEAEEMLAGLLGYTVNLKGASSARHHGIPGLLWVEQGHTQELAGPVDHASQRLNAALAEQVGDLASSSGDAVIAEVEQRHSRWLTAKGNPRKEYQKILDDLQAGQAKLAELGSQISSYHQQVDALGRLLQQQVDIDAAEPWLAEETKAKAAQTRLDETQAWQRQQEQDQQQLKARQDSLQLYREQLRTMAAEAEQLQQRAQDRGSAQNALQACQQRKPELDAAHTCAQQAYQNADALCKQARAQARRQHLQAEHQRLAQALESRQKTTSKAKELQTTLGQLRGQLQPLDPKQLARLQDIHRQLAELRVHQAAIATRLQYELLPGQNLQLGPETLSGQGERQLLEATELNIPGIGRLQLTPGGSDVADLARQQHQLQQRSADMLAQLGVPSLDQAEQRASQNNTLAQHIREHEIELRTLAPDGAQALLAANQADQQRLAELATQLQQLPAAPAHLPGEAAAEQALEQALATLKQAEQALSDYNSQLAAAEQAHQSADTEWQKLQQALAAPDRQQRQQQAEAKIVDLNAQISQLQAAMQARQQRIDAAQPDILQQDVARHSRSAQAMRDEAHQRQQSITSLRGELRALGTQDLQDQHDALAAKVAALQRRQQELAGHTAALDLLLQLLQTERAAVTRQLQAPLQKHLQRYLQLLFRQAELSVNEQLLPDTLTRQQASGGHASPVDQLSFGAREQMGLLSRLAYADLLQAAGRPTLLILDDALVHSDAQRLEHMQRILFDAATRHQILLFSCHPQRWRSLGVPARDLPTLKAQVS